MNLYHGSHKKLDFLEKRNSKSKYAQNPQLEKREAIYLTTDFAFALANAVRHFGIKEIDNKNKVIVLEKENQFDPQNEVYVYLIDSNKIPKKYFKKLDEIQFSLENVNKLKPEKIIDLKAGEVLKYFQIRR